MRVGKPGWTDQLRRHGPEFLQWLSACGVLRTRFNAIATALQTLLYSRISTTDGARAVWDAAPTVLSRCNDQSTYEMRGAPEAYAWLHLLDRYVRTWRAMEHLVAASCLPLARNGVRVLDVGTGPGPAAFATYDFYAAMTQYGLERGLRQFNQPPAVTCVEFDPVTNQFRHHLAEVLFNQTGRKDTGVLAMCHALSDFHEIIPSEERERLKRQLLWEEYEYFNESRNEWDSEPRYSTAEVNNITQSLHRYRLIIFSNFLTTIGATRSFERNMTDVLSDAQPGSVILVLGGKGGDYPTIYDYVDTLATNSDFQLVVAEQPVSSADTPVADAVFTEGATFYNYLQRLAPDDSENTKRVRQHFDRNREPAPTSHVRAYRKYGRARTT